MLFGPEALLELREDMMLPISSLLVGFRNIELSHSSLIQSKKCLCEYFTLLLVVSAIEANYSLKVLAIGIGYSIIIITREQIRCTGSYIFKRDQGFDSFSCVFNVILICFKIFIIISLFTFLHQSGKHVSVVFVFIVSFLFQYRMLRINEFTNLFFN